MRNPPPGASRLPPVGGQMGLRPPPLAGPPWGRGPSAPRPRRLPPPCGGAPPLPPSRVDRSGPVLRVARAPWAWGGAAALGRAPRCRCGCRLAAAAARGSGGREANRPSQKQQRRVVIVACPIHRTAQGVRFASASERCNAGRGPPPPPGGAPVPLPRSSVARGGPGPGPAPSQPFGLRGAPVPGGRVPRRYSRRLPPGFGVRARSGAARPSLPPRCGGSPALLRTPRPLLRRGLWPLRGAAPARRARALSPPPAWPPGSLARPLCAASRLRGRSLAPSGSRAALRSAAGSPFRGRPCSLRASRAPARGPAGPPRRFALRASGGGALRPGGLRGPSGRLLWPPAPGAFCAPALRGLALVLLGPSVFRCGFLPVGFSLFPPRPLPPLGEGGARGWLRVPRLTCSGLSTSAGLRPRAPAPAPPPLAAQ